MQKYTGPVRKKGILRAVLLSGLLVGTLDITATCIQAGIGGIGPERVLRYVASGVFGEMAFSGTVAYAFFGLLFHYFIAMCWTVLFFILYRRLHLWKYNRMMTGVAYGIFVGLLMNFIVVPLSNVPRGPVGMLSAVIAVAILIVAIGLPLSFRAYSFYSGLQKGKGG